jgi:hypothetical protein
LDCLLDYIPQYLHTNDKPIVKEFTIGEELYYRCKAGECKKPYDKISLYDISHNRNFHDGKQYPKEDVLYNTNDHDPSERHESDIVVLKITELSKEQTFSKELVSQSDPDVKAHITLLHDPLPCMYTHSVFEISINETIIDRENYNTFLGKSNRLFKNLRSDIRQELSSIIQTGIIDQNQNIEFLEDL